VVASGSQATAAPFILLSIWYSEPADGRGLSFIVQAGQPTLPTGLKPSYALELNGLGHATANARHHHPMRSIAAYRRGSTY
jgi:hypothetical protein